jgi:fucose permease
MEIVDVEVAGIIIGMIFFATIANELGRKVGSRGTVTIMLIGSIILCSAYGYDATTMFIMLDVGLGIFAFGVGKT